MFEIRVLHQHKNIDTDGTKCYRISVSGKRFDDLVEDMFMRRLAQVKAMKNIDWVGAPSFVIFHQGAQYPYLILCWWQNGNELFTSVSVKAISSEKGGGWQEDASQYSFCMYDLDIMAAERALFIQALGDKKLYQSMWYDTNEILCEPLLESNYCLEKSRSQLSLAEIEHVLNDINRDGSPVWSVVRKKLVANYSFDSFNEAFEFVKKVVDVAEDINHHPCIIHDFKNVRLEITSHDVGCITGRDILFAKRVGSTVQ